MSAREPESGDVSRNVVPGGPARPALPDASAETVQEGLTRRALLGAMAKIGLATAVAGGGALKLVGFNDDAKASTSASGSGAKHAWCMVIDLRDCDGCKACTLACRDRHQLPTEQEWIKVYSLKDAEGATYHMPRPCMMCEDPPCMYVCPVGATFRNDEGLVLVDQNVCIGCRTCMAACPYQARYFNWQEPPPVKRMPMAPSPEMPVPQKKGTVGKCVFCADRLPHGELPACVSGCPMGVIYIGDLVEDVATNGMGTTVKLSKFLKDNDAVRFQEELGTNPRVWYILGHGQSLGGVTA